MTPTFRPFAVALVLIAGAIVPARADTVILKNGRRIEGRVVQEDDREVAIETRGSIMRFERRLVARIEITTPKTPGTKPETPPPPPPADGGAAVVEVPAGATDDEAERVQRLVKELREQVRRARTARAELAEARAHPQGQNVQLAQERVDAAEKEIDRLRTARSTIERTIQTRLAGNERRWRAEADGVRAAISAHRDRGDAAAIVSLSKELAAKLPGIPATESRRRMLLDVMAEASAMAGELELATAGSRKDRAGASTAGSRFVQAWRSGDEASPLRSRYRTQAIEALTLAHRLTPPGAVPYDVERALCEPFGFEALATLVDERLGPRRWGALCKEHEGGRFKLELEDGRTIYSEDIPTNRFARVVWERRERQEPPASPPKGTIMGPQRTERWFELTWDPKRRLWARETDAMRTDARIPALARELTPLADEILRSLDDRVRAARDLGLRKEQLSRALRQTDEGTGSDDATAQAQAAVAAAEKTIQSANARIADFDSRLHAKRLELDALFRAAERARQD